MEKPDIYRHRNYRSYLNELIETAKDQDISIRSLSRQCGVSSPSYFQRIISGERTLTSEAAHKISNGLGFGDLEKRYFLALQELETGNPEFAMEEMQLCLRRVNSRGVVDQTIYSSWLNAVIFEAASIPGMLTSVEAAHKRLCHVTDKESIKDSLDLAVSKGWLVKKDGQYQQSNIRFEVIDDIRMVDLQRSHLRHLELAKHRINDDLDDREFQGLTVAVSEVKFKKLKGMIKNFMDSVDEFLEADEDADRIIRVQCCAFNVTRENNSD